MEHQVSNTILEKKEVVMIGGEKYEVSPPSIATLVLFSKFISRIPKDKLDSENAIASILQVSDELINVSCAIASVILGAEEFDKMVTVSNDKGWKFGVRNTSKELKKGNVLANKINLLPITEVVSIFSKILEFMNFRSFFQLTTFLMEMNLIEPTKKVGTTVSGR